MKNFITACFVLMVILKSHGQYDDYSTVYSFVLNEPDLIYSQGSYIGNADWDNDGDLDLMFGPAYLMLGQKLLMLENLGNNSFASALTVVHEPVSISTYAQYHMCNLDNEGAVDLIAIEPDATGVVNNIRSYIRGASNELIFSSVIPDLPGNYGVDATFDLEVYDFNNDGMDDFVYLMGKPIESSSVTEISFLVYFNQGNGVFYLQDQISYQVSQEYVTEGAEIILADLNSDGYMDIQSFGGFGTVHTSVLISDPAFHFTSVGTGNDIIYKPINFNGDGALDLIQYAENGEVMYDQAIIRLNTGASAYSSPSTYALQDPVWGTTAGMIRSNAIYVEDVNADGFDDLFVGGNVHVNSDGASFFHPIVLGNPGSANDVTAVLTTSPFGDFDNDGLLDLIGGDYSFDEDVFSFYYFHNCGALCDVDVFGCMDINACNYDASASVDDGTCEYCSCDPFCGCTDPLACNYDPIATIDDGSCYSELIVMGFGDQLICPGTLQGTANFYPTSEGATILWSTNSTSTIYNADVLDFYAEILETSSFTLTVTDINGCVGSSELLVTVQDCFYGCTDASACNYDVIANIDDGLCDYSCFGCTDVGALNYDSNATQDDGSCLFPGEGNTCSNPIILDCSTSIYENTTVDVINDDAASDAMACGGNSPAGQRWYSYTAAFSSEITVNTISPNTNFDTYLKVFTGTCGDLTCVGQNDDMPGNGLQSQYQFNAQAGVTYLIRVGGFIGSEGTYVLSFDCNGGCLDEAACNYDANAPFDNGSCTYGQDCYGCTNPLAENYDPIAVYNQGCQFRPDILVFHDMNGNGILNNGEPGLSNWPVYIAAMSATFYTDATGHINVNLPASSFQIELINNSENWVSSNADAVMIDVPEAMSAEFGLIPSTGETFFVAGPYNGFWDIIHCNNGYETGVFINNTGSTALNGVLTMTCDPSFYPEADVYGTVSPTMTSAGFAQWDISNFFAGSSELFSMHIAGPGVDNIGDTYNFNFNLILVDENGNEFYNQSWETTPFIACAYDPNDITATPEGFYDPHFILPGQRLQYRIRFQNTGNLYAEDVMIMDQLDPAVFDLSTFQPLYSSASMVACLHDDGLVDFIFNDIFLPDSASDEEGSHGFVVYYVDAREDLIPYTVLYNQASIFFEQNPAIITNQVFHTIFDCSSFTPVEVNSNYCENEVIEIDAEQEYVEGYSWWIDDFPMASGPVLEIESLQSGMHTIVLTTSNPLCEATSESSFNVVEAPEVFAGDDAIVCAGSSLLLNATSNADVIWSNAAANGSEYTPIADEILTVSATNQAGCIASDDLMIAVSALPSDEVSLMANVLTALDGATWQWFFNGAILEGENSQSITVINDGEYYVIVTNEDGCSITSQAIVVVNVLEQTNNSVRVYPNPMSDQTAVTLPDGLCEVVITDALGRVVFSRENFSRNLLIQRENMTSGVYHLTVKQKTFSYTTKLVVN